MRLINLIQKDDVLKGWTVVEIAQDEAGLMRGEFRCNHLVTKMEIPDNFGFLELLREIPQRAIEASHVN
jgi:hypothetical protein